MSLAYDTFDRSGTLALRLDAELRRAHPRTILEAAVESFGDKLALVSSFGAESAVLLDIAAKVKPDIAVLFLDTGMLFGQTLDYRQQLAARLGLTNVRDLRPQYHDLATGDPQAKLWQTDTDACCHIRKVLPLDRALGEFDAWITGRKRFHGGDQIGRARSPSAWTPSCAAPTRAPSWRPPSRASATSWRWSLRSARSPPSCWTSPLR